MIRKLLVVDTETGGIDPARNAILSLAAVVYNDGPEEHVHLLIKDPLGEVEERTLAIHGITPERLEAEGVTPWEAVTRVQQLLLRNDMRGKVTLAGHNLLFDVGFMKRLWEMCGLRFEDQFHYGGLDTKVAALLLMQAGRLNTEGSSLAAVGPAVGVKPWKEHDALNDALATARTLKRMLGLIANPAWPVHPA